ncbi:T4SS efffector SepA family protein [uncultured Celeribacter sp.]|uniref:T4SS efffector SepA family protein n=1 Tax=uncultured Celeribacter sp. TaxID=1303376 RepID=UPI002AA770BB|nr:hypothetical protein [uncultured Celeribacter sp.]
MKSIEIEDDDFEYMKSLAIPLEDTTSTIISRIFSQHRELTQAPKLAMPKPIATAEFRTGNLPNVSFTSIKSASISDTPCPSLYWNDILQSILARSKGHLDLANLRELLSIQLKEGKHTENGYRYIESLGLSFQGVDARRACQNIQTLAKALDLPVKIVLHWNENSKAQYPGQTGTLIFP